MKRRQNRPGFSLIEVVVALAIFAMAAVVLTETFVNALLAREKGASNDARNRDIQAVRMQLLLEPNREVAPQYFPWQLDLADGSSFTGIALRKGGRSGKEFYRDITGSEQAILKSDIVAREEIKSSLMPPGLIFNLTPSELRDLVAFLQASGVRD